MAESLRDSSNSIFEIMADWEHQLQHVDFDFEELSP